jgi:nicotinamide riboside kinase
MKLEQARALKDRLIVDLERLGTLQVGIYGGPGVGKSTFRAALFAELKLSGINVEDVPEYAKDLVWEKAEGKLAFQPYIIAKQMWRMRRLEGQVDVIVTDTSTLLSLIYGGPENGVTPEFREWVLAEYRKSNVLDFYLERNPNIEYVANGRTQRTLNEAKQHDLQIKTLLDEVGMGYEVLGMKDFEAAVDRAASRIDDALRLSSNGTDWRSELPVEDDCVCDPYGYTSCVPCYDEMLAKFI